MASEQDPGRDPLIRASVTWPRRDQVVRQLGMVAAIAVLWGGVFWGAMHLPSGGDTLVAAERDAGRRGGRRGAPEGDGVPADTTATVIADEGASVAAAEPARAKPAEVEAAPSAPSEPRVTTQAAAAAIPAALEPASAAPDPGPDSRGGPEPEGDPLAYPSADEGPEAVSFAVDVLPILERRCVKCHGGEREEGGRRVEEGLSLLTWEDIMKGSTWGSVVEPGDAVGSFLLEQIQTGEMPDKEPRLLPREVRVIERWIAAGAKKN